MPSWWPSSDAPLMGIDLGPRQARFLACARHGQSWRIERWALQAIPPDAMEAGRILQFEALVRVLREGMVSAGGGPRIALTLPPQTARTQVLTVPASLRPWGWKRWLSERAEELGQMPIDALVYDVQMLTRTPLTLRLSVCPLEVVQDWQGLAEAAGLELVLIDDRSRVMHLALQALGMAPDGAATLALAEVEQERCHIHLWQAGEPAAQWEYSGPEDAHLPSSGGWLIASDEEAERWSIRLAQDAGGHWPLLDPLSTLSWPEDLARPADAGTYLVALGLALRGWRH